MKKIILTLVMLIGLLNATEEPKYLLPDLSPQIINDKMPIKFDLNKLSELIDVYIDLDSNDFNSMPVKAISNMVDGYRSTSSIGSITLKINGSNFINNNASVENENKIRVGQYADEIINLNNEKEDIILKIIEEFKFEDRVKLTRFLIVFYTMSIIIMTIVCVLIYINIKNKIDREHRESQEGFHYIVYVAKHLVIVIFQFALFFVIAKLVTLGIENFIK